MPNGVEIEEVRWQEIRSILELQGHKQGHFIGFHNRGHNSIGRCIKMVFPKPDKDLFPLGCNIPLDEARMILDVIYNYI